jgi:ParB-like nuclease domain
MSDIANSRLKSGVKEKFSVSRAAPLQFGRFALLPIMELKPDPSNPRKHGREQIRAIARSIAAFGFNAPILIDRNKQIVAGHGRYEAAKLNQCAEVPVVWLEHLTETQARAYMLADNKFTDRSSWDDAALAVHLKELSELVLDFDIEDIGIGHLFDDRAALRFEVFDQCPSVLPVNEGSGSRNGRQPFGTSFATSPGLWAPASSNRRRCFTAALPVLTSISNSARHWAPSASRFVEFRVFFEDTS